jgi:hypothetical protein
MVSSPGEKKPETLIALREGRALEEFPADLLQIQISGLNSWPRKGLFNLPYLLP